MRPPAVSLGPLLSVRVPLRREPAGLAAGEAGVKAANPAGPAPPPRVLRQRWARGREAIGRGGSAAD